MADNVTIPATGSGDATPVVATDQDASAPNAHYQLVKAVWGPLNTFNIVDTATGKPLPVQVRSSTGLIPLGEPTDAAATQTDTTSVTAISIWKQISKSIQLMVFGAGTAAAAQRTTLASDDPAVATLGATTGAAVTTDANGTIQQYLRGLIKQWLAGLLTYGSAVTVSTSVTKSSTTTTYTVGDCWSDSTSAPTAGGFTFTGAARTSGGSGIITDIWITNSVGPALMLQGELWIYDSAVSVNDNDNAAFTNVDADVLLAVAVVPFTLAASAVGSVNSYAHIQNLNIGFTCVGSANLRFKVKVQNAYVNTASEVLNFRLKIVQTN